MPETAEKKIVSEVKKCPLCGGEGKFIPFTGCYEIEPIVCPICNGQGGK